MIEKKKSKFGYPMDLFRKMYSKMIGGIKNSIKLSDIEEKSLTDLSIIIASDVIDRMKDIVSLSNVEEGGKLIGFVSDENGKLTYHIVSYIDSGVLVNNSSTHLLPSGRYQRSLYELITSEVDSSFEHIGTWHSHHCNGLDVLSQGDIDGYYDIVNREEYVPKYFIAILLVMIDGKVDYKVYLFEKGKDSFKEVLRDEITMKEHSESKINATLQTIELINFNDRNQRLVEYSYDELRRIMQEQHILTKNEISIDELVRKMLVEDIAWLKSNSIEYTAVKTKDNYLCLKFIMDGMSHVGKLYYPIKLSDRKSFEGFSHLSTEERINLRN